MCTLFVNLYVLLTRGPYMVYIGPHIYFIFIWSHVVGWVSKWSNRHNRSAYSPEYKTAPRCIGGRITGQKHCPAALLTQR